MNIFFKSSLVTTIYYVIDVKPTGGSQRYNISRDFTRASITLIYIGLHVLGMTVGTH